jgi:3-hydroxyisobutyrate dehydrogenase-like beta-hydroxyacid dehydrogenase
MARNLLHHGHELIAYNRTRHKAEGLASDGAQLAGTPAEAARDAEAVLTMLADDHAVEEVAFGEQGIAGAMREGSVHVSHSTISVALPRRLAEEHMKRGQHFISAPVFGRPEAAESAKLAVVVAGAPQQIDRCRPLFDAIGQRTVVIGNEPWQANVVKLGGNFMIASMLESFGEAFALMRKAGVEPSVFLDVMNGLFKSPVYENYGGLIARRQFEPAGFALKLGLKDQRLVLAAAEELSSPMPVASLLRDRMLAALARGQGDLDWSSATRIAAFEAGLE